MSATLEKLNEIRKRMIKILHLPETATANDIKELQKAALLQLARECNQLFSGELIILQGQLYHYLKYTRLNNGISATVLDKIMIKRINELFARLIEKPQSLTEQELSLLKPNAAVTDLTPTLQ